MKTAKDYYTDTFEGIRMTVCGVAMLVACGCKFVASCVCRIGKRKEKDKKQEELNGSKIEDANIVGGSNG